MGLKKLNRKIVSAVHKKLNIPPTFQPPAGKLMKQFAVLLFFENKKLCSRLKSSRLNESGRLERKLMNKFHRSIASACKIPVKRFIFTRRKISRLVSDSFILLNHVLKIKVPHFLTRRKQSCVRRIVVKIFTFELDL